MFPKVTAHVCLINHKEYCKQEGDLEKVSSKFDTNLDFFYDNEGKYLINQKIVIPLVDAFIPQKIAEEALKAEKVEEMTIIWKGVEKKIVRYSPIRFVCKGVECKGNFYDVEMFHSCPALYIASFLEKDESQFLHNGFSKLHLKWNATLNCLDKVPVIIPAFIYKK